jgi:hypothetical protein
MSRKELTVSLLPCCGGSNGRCFRRRRHTGAGRVAADHAHASSRKVPASSRHCAWRAARFSNATTQAPVDRRFSVLLKREAA